MSVTPAPVLATSVQYCALPHALYCTLIRVHHLIDTVSPLLEKLSPLFSLPLELGPLRHFSDFPNHQAKWYSKEPDSVSGLPSSEHF